MNPHVDTLQERQLFPDGKSNLPGWGWKEISWSGDLEPRCFEPVGAVFSSRPACHCPFLPKEAVSSITKGEEKDQLSLHQPMY